MKDTLKNNIEDLQLICESINSMQIEEESKVIARSALSDARRELRKKLSTIESRERTKLKTVNIDGKMVELPEVFDVRERYAHYMHEEAIYQITKPYLEKDGTFHTYNYVWIDEGNKHVKLLVRTLGFDKYGDRYYLETRYYKDKRDDYPYLKKGIDPHNQKYKKYINKVLEYIRQFEGFESFHEVAK